MTSKPHHVVYCSIFESAYVQVGVFVKSLICPPGWGHRFISSALNSLDKGVGSKYKAARAQQGFFHLV